LCSSHRARRTRKRSGRDDIDDHVERPAEHEGDVPPARGRTTALSWVAGATALAAAAAWVLVASRPRPDWSIAPAPERISDARPVPSAKPDASAAASASGSPKRVTPSVVSSAPRLSATPEKSKPVTLSDEVALLDRARTALQQGDFDAALSMLETYERRPEARLGDEAALLRMEALAGAGRKTEAAELATRFLAANPTSTLADRARSYLDPREPGLEKP
jgi:hypothetical protein